jgi:Uma2 family endonuclease
MLARETYFYSHEEYFALEEQADTKSEYWRGEIVAMAGASINHNRISGNVFNALSNALRTKSCEAFMSDVRVWIGRRDIFTYPDVMTICGEPKFVESRTDTVTNPNLIIEVLSESTAAYDRSEKFQAYWTLPSLKEYVLIDQYRMRVEYFKRVSNKEWRLLVFSNPDEVLKLNSVGVEIPLNEIYLNVTWDEE